MALEVREVPEDMPIKAIGGGLVQSPLSEDMLGFWVGYSGKAPGSVVALRKKARELGYFCKTYRPKKTEGRPYNKLQVGALSLDLLAEEIGFICIEFATMQYERVIGKRVTMRKNFADKVVEAAE